ncbi:MAG: lipopolysaccharide kinase InaA family protein [Syntrophorhabdales bacterium]|jgi:tRNA A-37 threonylcarbamoyl transferase component Bud32
MKRLKENGISWFLGEHEGLAPAVADVAEEENIRRSYTVREYGGGTIFIKYFLERGIAGFLRNRIVPRGRKEYHVARLILARSVATPPALGYGVGARGSFVIQERIEGRTLKSALDSAASAERGPLLDALALFLGHLAARGIRHNDLHLDNILLSEGRLYLIDLHKAYVGRAPVDKRGELANLTQALAMIHQGMTAGEKRRFFEVYGRPDIQPVVEAGLRAQWTKWIDSKMKRAFSTTSKLQAVGGRVFVRGREEEGRGSFRGLIKKDRKVRVERYGDHIRKTYRVRHRLVRAWEVLTALEYLALDIVPRPFFVEVPSLFRSGYVAMEDLGPYGEELDRFLDRRYDTMGHAGRRAFIGAFSQFLAGLLSTGIVQKDMKACNVFVLADGFRFLDVEDIAFSAIGEGDLRRMLVQLNCSVPARIAARDRVRFFLRVTRPFPCDKKRLLRDVAEACLGQEIVYEGVSGLTRESWPGRQSHHLQPACRPTR